MGSGIRGPAKSVVVTGASTGIGLACVSELVRGGFRVWATVRTDADEKSLRKKYPDAVQVLRLDLTDEGSVREAGEIVCSAGPLYGLINNAGVALPGPLEYLPIDLFRRQLEVNLVGQLLMTQVMLPALWQARDQGDRPRIVMIGSIGGRIAGPMVGPYHAAKFGLAGLTDSLRAELAPFGIRVVLVEPGAVATPIWRRGTAAGDELALAVPAAADRYADQLRVAKASAVRAAARGIAPERAARQVVRLLTVSRPGPRLIIGRDAKAGAFLNRVLPHRMLHQLLTMRKAGR